MLHHLPRINVRADFHQIGLLDHLIGGAGCLLSRQQSRDDMLHVLPRLVGIMNQKAQRGHGKQHQRHQGKQTEKRERRRPRRTVIRIVTGNELFCQFDRAAVHFLRLRLAKRHPGWYVWQPMFYRQMLQRWIL